MKSGSKRSAEQVRDAANMVGKLRPGHHWVFDSFPARPRQQPAGHQTGFLGETFPGRFVESAIVYDSDQLLKFNYPPLDSEYFELTDLLEAAIDAEGSFTFIEAGAGFGRWSARAAMAANQLGIASRLVLIEGDPVHAQWAREMMAMNRIGTYRIIEAAVGAARGKGLFLIDVPEGTNPAEWYGQTLVTSAGLFASSFAEEGECYEGRPTHANGGWRAIEVETVTLADAIADLEYVDLIDFDIQGAEGDVIAGSIDLLTKRVRRLCIETHSDGVEWRMWRVLGDAGWICLRDLPANTTTQTPFGAVTMPGGGLQSWINPHLY